MQLGDVEAVDAARRLAETLSADVEVVICPTFTALVEITEVIRGTAIALGAQDCAWAERGALTGEVSPADLIRLGCRYVIVGHSERRQYLGETDAIVARKVRAALGVGLRPILCIGETSEQRRNGAVEVILDRQLRSALAGLELVGAQQLCVAYEPIWAIGTGLAATPADVARAHAHIANVARMLLGPTADDRFRVLYGGSVDPENVSSFVAQPNTHGVLAGTASQTAARLRNIVAAIAAGFR